MSKMKKRILYFLILLLLPTGLLAQVTVTGSTGADNNYTRLGLAFTAINGSAQTGNNIVITISGNTTETATATLTAGTWTSINIFPTTSGLSITGNLTTALINLNGADNVTIDGSVGQSGTTKDLTIANNGLGNAVSIQLINSAENNTVKNCKITGSGTTTNRGIIRFTISASGNGNDGNRIENNDISGGASGRPVNAIYSLGTVGMENSGNTIINNNIFDFFNPGITSTGIYIARNSSAWTISGNSFYETASLIPTASVPYFAIRINSPTGVNHVVQDNSIGGNAPSCTGMLTKTGAFNNVFYGIHLNVGAASASSVQNNTINNLNWSNSLNAAWTGIQVAAGNVNVGTTTGNSIGTTTGPGSITITSTTTGNNIFAINITGAGEVDCRNNQVGTITAVNADANASNFYGINKNAVAGTTTITNNSIGGALPANGINISSKSNANAQIVTGIRNLGTGTITISNNTIAYLTNGSDNTNPATAGRIIGISSSNGTNTFSNNVIHDLTISNANNLSNGNASATGISLTGASPKTITGNTIYNISNSNVSFTGNVTGIYFSGITGANNIISGNFIHSLAVNASSTSGSIYGIKIASGASTYSNNIITLSGNSSTTVYGIYETGAATNNNNLYFNTVYIGGSPGGGATNRSFALYSAAISNVRNFRNNIFVNARSTTGGSNLHYAIYIVAAGGTITCDYNDYFVSGTGGVLGYYGGNTTILPVVTGQDAFSFSVNPQFASAGGLTATDYVPSRATLIAITGTGIAADFAGKPRSVSIPSMGAFEITILPFVQVYRASIMLAGYSTLKEAFDAINSGTHTGALEVRINNNTTEVASAVLNGSGTANYTSVLIYPTATGIAVSGDLPSPLIDLDGAHNVTIDGRVNGAGSTKELTIINSSISATAGTSTVRLINDASNNIVRYCFIKGSTADPAAGILFLSTTTGTTGNDGNTFENNDITNAADASRPVNALYSTGTGSMANSGNSVSNNNIYNFLNRSVASNGIYLAANNSEWTISGNSFYETAPLAPTLNFAYNLIFINDLSGTGFTISGNYFGGNAPLGAGVWTKTNSRNNAFSAITVNVGTGIVSSLQNNFIQNINWSNSGAASWTGINILAGDVNIGTTAGNVIGAITGTGSITVSAGLNTLNVYGINISSAGITDCQNNIVGSITTSNAVLANPGNIYAINNTAVAGTVTIDNNTIGGATVNSINATSESTLSPQTVVGISNTGTGNVRINGNTVANLRNGTTNADVAVAGKISGIYSTNGTNIISNNVIHDLTIGNANTATNQVTSVTGIALAIATPKNVTGNTIYNLSNTNSSFSGNVVGLLYGGSTVGNTVSGNFIHSLSVSGSSTSASIYGIKIASGATTYSNNIITLTGNTSTTVYGIYETGAANNNNNLYFNTIYIGGNGSAANSYALYSALVNNVRNFRNNILMNARSSSGSNYALYIVPTVVTRLTVDYNDYWVTGTGGVIGYFGGDRTSLPVVTGQDVYSLNLDPTFTNPGTTVADDYKILTAPLVGVTGTGIIVDYGLNPRSANVAMGAWEKDINLNRWRGTVSSSNWNIPANWTAGTIPTPDANLIFDASAANNLLLDQPRSVTDITNTTSWRIVTNGNKLTIKGVLISGQIDASAINSNIEFAGVTLQDIPAGTFLNDQTYNLTINNPNNVTFNGTLNLLNSLTATSGQLDGSTNSPTMTYGGTTVQSIEPGQFVNDRVYNLTSDNTPGVSLNTDFTVENLLTINTGKVFNISAPYLLSVPGTIVNNAGTGGFNIRSDANGNDGKLINNTASVPGTVELFLSGGTINGARVYHYFVPPVESMSILNGSSTTYPSTADVRTSLGLGMTSFTGDLVSYSEVLAGPVRDNGWLFFDGWPAPAQTTGFSSLVATSGYNFHVNSDDKITFRGLINGPDHSFNNLSFTNLGWNLVGNPYPCNYDLTGISALTASADGIDNTIYFNHNGGYAIYNVELGAGATGYSNIMPPMQGFFVHVTAAGTSVSLPASSKTGASAGPSRSKKSLEASSPVKKLKLVLNNGVAPDETIVCLVDNATSGFDSDYDAYKFPTAALTPAIYTEINAFKYALNTVKGPETQQPVIIPLSVIIKSQGTYTIDITEFENLEGMNVKLKHGTVETELSKGASYTFTSSTGTFTNFELIIGGSSIITTVELNRQSELKTWYTNNYLYINYPEDVLTGKSSIAIYDMQGKPVYRNNLIYVTPGQTIQLPVTLQKGIYVTNMIISSKSFVSKIVVY